METPISLHIHNYHPFLGIIEVKPQVEAIASHWRLCPNEETALFSRASTGGTFQRVGHT